MNTLIVAGGSGSRTLEALLHLCAAGHGPREPLRVLVIDPDRANGNARRVTGLTETYVALQKSLGGRLGPDRRRQPLRLFGTVLDLLGDRLQVWRPVGLGDTLRQSIDHARLAGEYAIYRDAARLLFTPTSLDLGMEVGYRGRPAIGAAALALLSRSAGEPPWNLLLSGIQDDVTNRKRSRVFVVGSVFGGTGASAIHPVARFLRNTIQADAGQLRIGVGALTPYFTFVDEDDNTAAKSRSFPLATRSAIEFYQHLRENGEWLFDAVYWVGDTDPVKYPTSAGGHTQENPAHFCELLAAFAAVDFFNHDVGEGECYYSGPRQPPFAADLGEKNVADWEDIPRRDPGDGPAARRDALRLFLMGMTHMGFWDEVLEGDRIDNRPECVPWYLRRFRDRSLRQTDRRGLELLGAYFKDHFFRWWQDLVKLDRVRYFNRALWTGDGAVDVAGRPNIRWPNDPKKRASDFDDVFELMVEAEQHAAGEDGLAQYVALLAHAADAYLDRHYRAETPAAPVRP